MPRKTEQKVLTAKICKRAEEAISRRFEPFSKADRRAVKKFLEGVEHVNPLYRRDFLLVLESNVVGGCFKSRTIQMGHENIIRKTLSEFSCGKDVGNLYVGMEYVYVRSWRAVCRFWENKSKSADRAEIEARMRALLPHVLEQDRIMRRV